MASLLVRAQEYRTGAAISETLDYFDDDAGSPHESAVNRAAAAGLASGRALGEFAPDTPLTREQLSTFLVRLLDLLVTSDTTA